MSILAGIQAQMDYDCHTDTAKCWCRGSGWILSDWDSFHECPCHPGKNHPDLEDEIWGYIGQWVKTQCVIEVPGLVEALVSAECAVIERAERKRRQAPKPPTVDLFVSDDLPF